MIAAIEIIREQQDSQPVVYRALRGNHQASGATPGEALDTLESLLEAQAEEPNEVTLVILQRFRPDAFFGVEQQARLQQLMGRWREARERGETLLPAEQAELEWLAQAEWRAASQRARALLRQVPVPRLASPPVDAPLPSAA